MTRLEELEKIINTSTNIPEEVIEERRELIDDLTPTVDFSDVEELFITATRNCRRKAKKIYESLSKDLIESEKWCIKGYLKAYTEDESEILENVFSGLNPFYRGEQFEVFSFKKDDVDEVLYHPEEFKITLMPWNIQIWNELYLFICLCKFPAQDIMKITKIYTEVVFNYYGE